ncbi:NB-ARC domain-containing protein [Streptomyces sp. WAC 01529]|uniref:ATP-binding protein n=1 Tax=Streptomyces sp. WAC 01529 TaxID=2203205 RepID=UPI0013E0A12E|nr:NB-ARC domain-containing protein [Streptomyces sp. WAC 01529]
MAYSDVVLSPQHARTPEDFIRLLRRLRAWSELTYRELEVRARRCGLHLARSTAAAVLDRGALPRAGFVRAYVAACGVPPEPWLDARQRIAASCTQAPGPVEAPVEAAVPLVPAQLPSDLADFTGREEQRRAVAQELTGAAAALHGVVPVVAVTGMAGIGKTALAVHTAHALTDRFPDGRLFVDLRGTSTAPAEPGEVLVRFLRALGVSPAAPVRDSVEELSALYRTVTAGRALLVVLDNAASERQVRPLLPGVGGPAVLVTSRNRLTTMGPSRSVELGPLSAEHGVTVLARIAGAERVAAEPEAAADIVRLCGRCPLALRVAGTRLACRGQWPLDRLAELLRDERGRLDELAIGDLAVRDSLEPGYATLLEATRRAFRLVARLGTAVFSAEAAAEVLDCPVDVAEAHLEALVDASLLTTAPADGDDRAGGGARYRMHDLVRLYAWERAVAEGTAA